MYVVRKKLAADDVTPRGTRYNPGTDTVQVSSDGGDTWTDAPGLDPRHTDAFRNPPLTTADPKCDAAANMVALLHTMIDADIAALNVVAAATAFVGLVSLFFPIVLVADLVLAVAGIVAGIGAVALTDAFTDDVYHRLICTFEAHLEADGTLTGGDLSDLLTDIGTNYDATVFDAISAHSSALGEVGWSNAGAAGSETGDCSDCFSGTCYGVDWVTFNDTDGVYEYTTLWINERGYCWQVVGDSSADNFSWKLGAVGSCLYTRVEIDVFTYNAGVEYIILGRTNNDLPDHDQATLGTGSCDVGLSTIGIDLPGTDSYFGLQIILNVPGSRDGAMDVHGARIFSPNLSAAGLASNC